MKKDQKGQVQQWKRRWEWVNAIEVEEMRHTSPEVRYQQFLTLLAWAKEFGWTQKLSEGEEDVRARWIRLKKAQRG